jgi:hypothetical protein
LKKHPDGHKTTNSAAQSPALLFEIMTNDLCPLLSVVRIWHYQLVKLAEQLSSAKFCHLRLSTG